MASDDEDAFEGDDQDFDFEIDADYLSVPENPVKIQPSNSKGVEQGQENRLNQSINFVPDNNDEAINTYNRNEITESKANNSPFGLGVGNFVDDDDELFSQIDENELGGQPKEISSPDSSQSIINSVKTSTPIQKSQRNQSQSSSGTNSLRGQNFSTKMAPPSTPIVPKRPFSALRTPTQPSQTAKPTPPSPAPSFSSQTSSVTANICLNKSNNNSREVFFANWDTDELSTYEQKLRTLKRHFPGPAGLLPKMSRTEVKLLDDPSHPLSQQISKIISKDLLMRNDNMENALGISDADKCADFICSPERERDILRINKRPWRELIRTLKLNPNDPEGLLNLANIRWIRRRVARHPVETKIPFLAVVVQEEPEIINKSGKRKNPSIKLMDPTGTIIAAMDAKFVDSYGTELYPGTAIAVKNVGFLRFRRHVILTITWRNVICMMSAKKPDPPVEKQLRFSPANRKKKPEPVILNPENAPKITETADEVRIIRFNEFCPQKAMEEYHKINNTKLDEDEETVENIPRVQQNRPTLFSSYIRPDARSRATAVNNSAPRPGFSAQQSASRSTVKASVSAPPKPVITAPAVQVDEDSCGFDDDDDDELMQALDNVDFLIEIENTRNDSNPAS